MILMSRTVAALCLVAVNCATSAPVSENGWTVAKVIDLHLELVDSNRVEGYWFTKNYVIPEVSSHDIVVDPLWHWKIRNRHLQIYSESQLEDELTLIKIDPKIVTVRKRSGAIARYRYSYHR